MCRALRIQCLLFVLGVVLNCQAEPSYVQGFDAAGPVYMAGYFDGTSVSIYSASKDGVQLVRQLSLNREESVTLDLPPGKYVAESDQMLRLTSEPVPMAQPAPEPAPAVVEPPLLTRLGTDELLLGEVICCLLAGQFEVHKVTEQEVRDAFDGNTLLAAQRAFYEELIDFFHGRGRADRAKAVAAQAKVIEAAVKAVEARIDALDVDEEIAGAMSGRSPAPSASTPGRSP